MAELTEQQAIVKLATEGVAVHVEASDIKIGAVEIQDSASDKRVDVENMNVGLEDVPAQQKGMLAKAQLLSADGTAIVSPRKENGHGSDSGTPSYVEFTNPIAGYDALLDSYKFIESPPSAIFGNMITLPATLPSQAIKKGATIKAHKSNVAEIMVNGMALESGESIPISIDNLNKILITGTAGDKAYYIGS